MREGWEYKGFEDCLVKANKAKQVQTSEYNSGTKYPIISQEDKMISGYCDDESFLYHINSPVVIFGDHTRVLKYVDFDFVVGADGVKILIPKNFLKAKFLYYYLQWYKVPSLGYSRHYKLLKEISLPIPSLVEQERIVSELDLLSGIIEKKKAQLKEYDKLAQSIFYDMFGDTVTNEKGWEVKKLCEVTIKIGSGATPKGGNQSYKNEGISLIRSLNVHNGSFKYEDLAHIDEKQAHQLSNVIVEKNDVLFNITGASVARCCIVPSDVLPARVNQHVSIIRPQKEIVNYVFLCYHLISPNSQNSLLVMSKSNAATREALPKSMMEKYPICIPPLPLQQSFASKIEAIERQKALIQQSITETETLFNSRMDYYFD